MQRARETCFVYSLNLIVSCSWRTRANGCWLAGWLATPLPLR